MEGGGHRCAAFVAAMEILGKPWNGLVLRALGEGPLRFSAIAERMAIGDRMLSCRLKELEAAGLVDRTVDPGPPVRVSYALTPLGHGHNFAPDDYIEAWLALTEPAGWTEPEIGRLKALFAARVAVDESAP